MLNLCARAQFETTQPLAHIGREAGLGLLAIRQDVDARFRLPAHAFRNFVANACLESITVVAVSRKLGLHHIQQLEPSRQAADMGCQDAIRVLLGNHWRTSLLEVN